jgi:hypothetical protein
LATQKKAEKTLSESITTKVSIGNVSFDPRKELIINNLSIEDALGRECLKFKRVIIKHEPRLLFKGEFKIKKIDIVFPKITLAQDRGIWNINKVFCRKSKGGKATSDRVHRDETDKALKEMPVSIQGGTISLNCPKYFRKPVAISGVNIISDTSDNPGNEHLTIKGKAGSQHCDELSFAIIYKKPEASIEAKVINLLSSSLAATWTKFLPPLSSPLARLPLAWR